MNYQKILSAIEQQQEAYFIGAARREEEERSRQQNYAQVAGYREGKYLVSLGGGGFTEAIALSNSSFKVGSMVSHYSDGGVCFIDQAGV